MQKVGRTPVPVPNLGQLLIGGDAIGRSDITYHLVVGTDGRLTVWRLVSDDGGSHWKQPPIPFEDFEHVRIDGVPLTQLILQKFAKVDQLIV